MIYALIVMYNKNCVNSKSFNFMKKYKDKIKTIIFDNSTIDLGNKKYCDKNNIEYYSVNKNIGLSKAYNYVISKIDLSPNNYLIILDDDTQLNDEYIEEVLENIKTNEYDIYLPIIKSNQRIISPSNVQFNCRVKAISDIKQINMKKITAINSGMIIKTSIYNEILYNEQIFLDYVDHDFMKNVRKNKYKIKILNSVLEQNFSRDEKGELQSELIRYKIYKKDFKAYCKNCKKITFYYINIFRFSLKQCIKFKTLKFLKRG